MPDWFELIMVARWAGVAPWALARKPRGWRAMMSESMSAEAGLRARAERARGMRF